MNANPNVVTYPTTKLLEDRHTFEIGASLCRTAMLFDVLVARQVDEPDALSEAQELIDVLQENLQAIQIIDQELTRREEAAQLLRLYPIDKPPGRCIINGGKSNR